MPWSNASLVALIIVAMSSGDLLAQTAPSGGTNAPKTGTYVQPKIVPKSSQGAAPLPTVVAPLTTKECLGLGGKVIDAIGCSGGKACSTVGANGVVRSKCINR